MLDLNYRNKLWDYAEFEKVMVKIIKDVDVCFGWMDKKNDKAHKIADFAKQGIKITKGLNTYFLQV